MCHESRVQQQLPFLRYVESLPTKAKCKIISKCKSPQINAISEIAYNFLKANLTDNRKVISKLKPYKKLIKILSLKKTSLKKKRNILKSPKGGSILSILVPLVTSLFV